MQVFTQKEIAEYIDSAARRSYDSKASGKQCWFLAKLISETDNPMKELEGWELNASGKPLTSKRASFIISTILDLRK
ncbi:MAG: hypothetical protein MI867_12610 [Pseudomonadales bacterium]|nr:hypothetical protein [Pseudomonadales bacterium]